MRLHFLGANHQVTGSRHLLHAGGKNILVDCGLFQERAFQSRNWDPFPIPPSDIDVLLLTHAHLDHCGLIPKLVREGFKGDILGTPPTLDLARIIWEDSARIQEEDAAYKKRRHEREGRKGPHPVAPLYTVAEAQHAMKQLQIALYDKPIDLGGGVTVVYREAGHILGSAMLEVSVREHGKDTVIVFSGDVGVTDRPLLKDPYRFAHADYVLMESTYGDRDHEEGADPLTKMEQVVNETVERAGNLIVPTFAIDRAQELLYHLSELAYAGRIPRVTVFMDSPMAIRATTIYKRFAYLLDDETKALLDSGKHPFQFPGLHFVRTPDESRSINSIRGSAIILAGSGMCTGGRVKHHLRQNIERPETTILFVGYQAAGTLGRRIVQGDKQVRIHGREYAVNARVEQLQGLSAHADRKGLLEWIEAFAEPPKALFLTHGEEKAATSLAEHIRKSKGWNVQIPEYGSEYELDDP